MHGFRATGKKVNIVCERWALGLHANNGIHLHIFWCLSLTFSNANSTMFCCFLCEFNFSFLSLCLILRFLFARAPLPHRCGNFMIVSSGSEQRRPVKMRRTMANHCRQTKISTVPLHNKSPHFTLFRNSRAPLAGHSRATFSFHDFVWNCLCFCDANEKILFDLFYRWRTHFVVQISPESRATHIIRANHCVQKINLPPIQTQTK